MISHIVIFRSSIVAAFCRLGAVALIAFAASTMGTAVADHAPPSVRIAHFAGDRAAAISYTFDDNTRDQYTLAVPMLNEVGFKGSFFVIAGKTAETPEEGEQKVENGNPRNLWGGISWPELKKMADQGHEIASHTWSHPALAKLTPEDLDAQLSKACEAIKTRIGKPPLTIAFPGNGSTPEVRAAALKYHVAYRAYQQSTSGKSTVASLNAWADMLVGEKKWGVIMAHGIANGYAALTDPEILRGHLRYVKSHEREIWVDTFANIARYEKERDDAKLKVSGTAGNITCTLGSTLDPKIYDMPLTIVIDADKATSLKAERAGKKLPARIGNGTIQVDAAPAPEPISITWKHP